MARPRASGSPRACAAYEDAIRAAGGIDFQLLGIGKTGHVGFNEPGSDAASRTRIVTLDTLTRRDAAADFFGVENVPREAITMGVATILDAKEIALLATGEHKAGIVARAVEGEISTRRRRDVPAAASERRGRTSTCRPRPSSRGSRRPGCSRGRRLDAGHDRSAPSSGSRTAAARRCSSCPPRITPRIS